MYIFIGLNVNFSSMMVFDIIFKNFGQNNIFNHFFFFITYLNYNILVIKPSIKTNEIWTNC